MAKITIRLATHEERFGGDIPNRECEVWAVDREDGFGITIVKWWDNDVWIYEYPPPKDWDEDAISRRYAERNAGNVLSAQLYAIELLGDDGFMGGEEERQGEVLVKRGGRK